VLFRVAKTMIPRLITFDIFGTVVDWRGGLRADLRALDRHLTDSEFERVIAAQAVDETGPFRSYHDITVASLVQVLGLDPEDAGRIADDLGYWPLFADSRDSLRRILQHVPCVAMTNSDRLHGQQVQQQLGFALSEWVCAEEMQIYKPRPDFWKEVGRRRRIDLGPAWWHVSAYADYDLGTADRLGLTTVFVDRPHSRPGPAHTIVGDLADLASLIDKACGHHSKEMVTDG
jgi:2-haloacid dehalogenase